MPPNVNKDWSYLASRGLTYPFLVRVPLRIKNSAGSHRKVALYSCSNLVTTQADSLVPKEEAASSGVSPEARDGRYIYSDLPLDLHYCCLLYLLVGVP